jgi:hypothetical protein
MADLAKTYSSADWSIWTYVPEPDSFVLDFSQLDGPDTLGFSEGSLQRIDAEIASISLSEGAEITEGLFHTIAPARLSAELVIENFTATDANKFLVGSQVALYLTNSTPTAYGTLGGYTLYRSNLTNFFQGEIDSFSVQLEPGSNFATIMISGISNNSKSLNTLIGVEKNTTSPRAELITAANTSLFWSTDVDQYNFGVTEFEEKTLGDFLNDFVTTEVALVADQVVDSGTGFYNVIGTAVTFYPYTEQVMKITGETEVGSPSVEFDDSNVSSIGLDWSGAGSPTGVALSLYSNSEITYNFGNSNSVGAFVYSGTADVKDLTQLQAVGNSMLNFNKAFSPVTIVTETARTYQSLIFKETTRDIDTPISYFAGVTMWLKPVELAEVLQTVSITNTELGYTDLPMIVTGRTIEITPDNWITTYNLWKGFTN